MTREGHDLLRDLTNELHRLNEVLPTFTALMSRTEQVQEQRWVSLDRKAAAAEAVRAYAGRPTNKEAHEKQNHSV